MGQIRTPFRRDRLRFVAVVLLLAVAAVTVGPGGVQAQDSGESRPVIVTFTGDLSASSENTLVGSMGGTIKNRYAIVPAVSANLPPQAIDALAKNPRVARIEPDVEIETQDHDAEASQTWGTVRVGALEAQHDGYTGAGVRVAVFDTGIDTDHSDLSYDPGCSNGTSYGTVEDGNGHGTHTSGTIAARVNGSGVVGVAPEAILCVFKVLDDDGMGMSSDLITALDAVLAYNQAHPADRIRVANHSYEAASMPQAVADAFNASYQNGVLHVAAAGNEGNAEGTGESCGFPAKAGTVVAVAALDDSNNRAGFSSTCPELELAAPGVDILSTFISDEYAIGSGTSMASPHVTGVAALVMSANPSLTPEEVRDILRDTATPLGAANLYGSGLPNAPDAIAEAIEPGVLDSIAVSPGTAAIEEGDTRQFAATATYSDGSTADVSGDATWTSANESTATVDDQGLATGLAEGTATIMAAIDGVEGSASLTVTAASIEPPVGTYSIFDDSLHWDNWSWGTTLNAATTSPVFGGDRSMSVTYNRGWAGVYLNRGAFDTTPYDVLRFAIHTGGNALPNVRVALFDASGNRFVNVDPRGYAESAGGGWQMVTIPLENLGAADTTVSRVRIMENAGITPPTFYIDDLGFFETVATPFAPPPTLQSIAVSPSTAEVQVGATQQFTATATYSDGSTADVSGDATWTSANESVATIDGQGLATGQAAGTSTITAMLDGAEATASVSVAAASIVPPAQTYLIYDDELHWSNWSWSTSIDTGDPSPVHDGTRSMSVTYNSAWAGVLLHRAGFDTSPYTRLQFAINTGGSSMPRLKVSLRDTNGSTLGSVIAGNYDEPLGDGWRLVSIPLADLNAAGQTVSSVMVQEAIGSPPPAFNIDNLGFLGGGTTHP